jgi:ADP-ribose pyrophosphatase YjhB (NUDIX family)
LLIKRKYTPFINKWALPGGFVEANEPLKNAIMAAKKLADKLKKDTFTT